MSSRGAATKQAQSVAVTGHRRLTPDLDAAARASGSRLALDGGVATVFVGGAIGADTVVLDAIVEAGGARKVVVTVPDTVAAQPAKARASIARAVAAGARVDELKLGRAALVRGWGYHRRNRRMVDQADVLFAVWDGRRSGGTWATIRYARDIGRQVVVVRES